MHLALVSMPWLGFTSPSVAIAALTAFLKQRAPDLSVEALHEHVHVSQRIGSDLYARISSQMILGECLFATLLHPGGRPALEKRWVEWASCSLGNEGDRFASCGGGNREAWGETLDRVLAEIEGHARDLAHRLADRDVVGLTTDCSQLYASLYLCSLLKKNSPEVRTVLGGTVLDKRVGPSVLAEHPFVDYVVQGEGEQPLLDLLRGIAGGETSEDIPGVLSRSNVRKHPDGIPHSEVEHLDALPVPDYDSYFHLAERHALEWRVYVEGSRGCWWDRTTRTGDPRDRCLFCSMTGTTFREKTPLRVAEEVATLSERYANPRVFFVDNTLPHTGLSDLAAALTEHARDYDMVGQFRASIDPRDAAALRGAGLTVAHVGVEGFSTRYLRRMGKGTTTIQNLQALKTFCELGIHSPYNLLIGFPGSTADEVRETVHNIERYASAYRPPANLSSFTLLVGSAADELRGEFGIAAVRNDEDFRGILPERVWRQISLFYLGWEYEDWSRPADWSPVAKVCKRWKNLHQELHEAAATGDILHPKALFYSDCGGFLEIGDRRWGYRLVTLKEDWRRVYLYCLKIRPRSGIIERFACDIAEKRITEILDTCVDEGLMFEEDGQYLALAVATRPEVAVRRIRATDGPSGTPE